MVEVGGIDNLDGEGTDDSSRGGSDDLTKGRRLLGWGGGGGTDDWDEEGTDDSTQLTMEKTWRGF